MPDFSERMEQLLDQLGPMSIGRRRRLLRPLRQDDAECWPRPCEASLEAAMKAAMRVASHELLDLFCLHLEGALEDCASDEARTLLLAITAIHLSASVRVVFRRDGRLVGVSYPARETTVIEPRAVCEGRTVDLMLERETSERPNDSTRDESVRRTTLAVVCDGEDSGDAKSPDAVDFPTLRFTAQQIADNPYLCATEAMRRLRFANDDR